MTTQQLHIPAERIEKQIFLIRGHKVMLDRDLAKLYGVPTKVLNQAVRRHIDRFPADFVFQLTMDEARAWLAEATTVSLRSQFVTLKRGQHIKYRPYTFTEHGILMLSSVLNSERAIQVNIAIMRAFVQLRQILGSHQELAKRLIELERKLQGHDVKIKSVFRVIKRLMAPSKSTKQRIGFHVTN